MPCLCLPHHTIHTHNKIKCNTKLGNVRIRSLVSTPTFIQLHVTFHSKLYQLFWIVAGITTSLLLQHFIKSFSEISFSAPILTFDCYISTAIWHRLLSAYA